MKSSIRFFLGFSALIWIACFGCNSNPQADIKAAQHAMENAKDFRAEELAASDWKEALQVWEEGQTALAKGQSSKAYFRKAKALFEKTEATAKANGDAMKKEIQGVQKTINEQYMKVRAAIEQSRSKSKIQKQFKPMLDEVAVGSSSVGDLIMQGDYPKAKTMIQDIQKKMSDVESMMEAQKVFDVKSVKAGKKIAR
jgi:hypothetical protein